MKVNIIKGPNYEKTIEKGYKLLYQILSAKIKSGELDKELGKDPVNLKKDEKS